MTAESKGERLRRYADTITKVSLSDLEASLRVAAGDIERLEREKEEAVADEKEANLVIQEQAKSIKRLTAELARLKSPMEGAKTTAEERAEWRLHVLDDPEADDWIPEALAELALRLLDDLDHATAQARSAADAENEACARIADTAALQHQEPGGTEPKITHEQARESMQRLVDHYFHNKNERVRASIPARPDYDDDLILSAYIEQQAARATTPPAPSALDRAVEEARTAGFNDAKERAVKVARAYGDSDASADTHNEPVDVAKGIETASRDIATALQAMKQGGSDD